MCARPGGVESILRAGFAVFQLVSLISVSPGLLLTFELLPLGFIFL